MLLARCLGVLDAGENIFYFISNITCHFSRIDQLISCENGGIECFCSCYCCVHRSSPISNAVSNCQVLVGHHFFELIFLTDTRSTLVFDTGAFSRRRPNPLLLHARRHFSQFLSLCFYHMHYYYFLGFLLSLSVRVSRLNGSPMGYYLNFHSIIIKRYIITVKSVPVGRSHYMQLQYMDLFRMKWSWSMPGKLHLKLIQRNRFLVPITLSKVRNGIILEQCLLWPFNPNLT